MPTFAKVFAIALGFAGLAALPLTGAQAQEAPKKAAAKKAASGSGCAPKRGRGWAPTEGMARFQAWEIVAQTTGNWPFMSDTFKNERYKCAQEGGQWRCDSWIDVCKKG